MLIVTDLDNTLLKTDKNISEYTATVFDKIRERGYLIAFATARGCAISRFTAAIKPHIIISNGGALISVNGEVIYRNLLSDSDVETIVSMCMKFTHGKALITVENDEGYYCNFVPRDFDRRMIYSYCGFENFKSPAYKVTIKIEDDEYAKEILKACSNCRMITFTGEKWHRYSAEHSDKATALKIIAEHVGVDLADVVAFGDDINDLGMMKLAGTAVAVANAIDQVKAVADYTTDSNDNDGVAKFIDEYLLRRI